MKKLQTINKNTPTSYIQKPPDWFDSKRSHFLLKYYKGERLLDLGSFNSLVIDIICNSKYSLVYKFYDWVPEVLPEKDESFDYIVMGQLLEHLDDPAKYLKEAIRVLKVGGVLALSVPLNETEAGEVDGEHHIWSFSEQDIIDLLKPYGRYEIEILRSEHIPEYRYKFPHIIGFVKKTMKIKQIVYTPMTGIGNFKNDNQWLRYRDEILREYTLKSMKNQAEKGFIHLLSYTPKEEDSPIVYKLWTDEPQLKFSLEGLLYHDDRFGDDHAKNRDLVKRLKCLKVLESECKDADWIYFTRIDSDDMYHKDAFKEIMEQKPGEKVAFMFKTGYIYNKETEEMATWEPTTCPPFYTICFPKEVFFNPVKHFRYMKGWRTHEDTEKIFKCKELSEGKYCVLVHGKNTTTTWGHPFRGGPINNKKLKYFI